MEQKALNRGSREIKRQIEERRTKQDKIYEKIHIEAYNLEDTMKRW